MNNISQSKLKNMYRSRNNIHIYDRMYQEIKNVNIFISYRDRDTSLFMIRNYFNNI